MSQSETGKPNMALFWGCFIALIATAFGFIVRAQIIGDWAKPVAEGGLGLSPSEVGEIGGVGLWPFAISIVFFSLIIDKVGPKRIMIFGFICHVLSAILTYTAKSYNSLYIATFICALGNGTVESYINPVVATMFSRDKTKWLNILHAGWPGGMVLGGLLALSMGSAAWQTKVLLILIPTIIYIVLLIGKEFPASERASAGVSYKDMLGEVGAIGAYIIFFLIGSELTRVFTKMEQPMVAGAIIGAFAAAGFFVFTKSLGKPLFILLLALMVPLATTELGVDSWVGELMGPAMGKWAPYILVYTSAIMTVLRFLSGPIVHKLTPLGVLALCAGIATLGLIALSNAEGAGMIFLAATLYGVGKTFFWPTTLGVVAEQFPKGVSGVGMLGVGVLGTLFLGNIQEKTTDGELKTKAAELHSQVMVEKTSLFGNYQSVDAGKLATLPAEGQEKVKSIQDGSKKVALKTVAMFPILMLVVYGALLLYFKSKGGYKPVVIGAGH
jgi:MFS family permease